MLACTAARQKRTTEQQKRTKQRLADIDARLEKQLAEHPERMKRGDELLAKLEAMKVHKAEMFAEIDNWQPGTTDDITRWLREFEAKRTGIPLDPPEDEDAGSAEPAAGEAK